MYDAQNHCAAFHIRQKVHVDLIPLNFVFLCFPYQLCSHEAKLFSANSSLRSSDYLINFLQ